MIAGLAAVAAALADTFVLARYRARITTVPGSECLWWTGAVSDRGHGRFLVRARTVVIAHRYAFAVMHAVEALNDARLLGHRCDNPLCQPIAPEHVVVSSSGTEPEGVVDPTQASRQSTGRPARAATARTGTARHGPR